MGFFISILYWRKIIQIAEFIVLHRVKKNIQSSEFRYILTSFYVFFVATGNSKMMENVVFMRLLTPHFGRFTNDAYWYSLALVLRRFAVALVSVMFDDSRNQLIYLTAILLASLVVNYQYQPYRFDKLRYCDEIQLVCQIFTLTILMSLAGS